MSIKLGATVEWLFCTSRFDTGALANADSLPVGTVYKNGTADGLAVTVANITTGVYRATFTPTTEAGFAAGNHLSLRIAATVNSVAGGGIVGQDVIDSVLLDDLDAKFGDMPVDLATYLGALTLALADLDTYLYKVLGAVAGKKVINAAGDQVEVYDEGDNLLVTLDKTTVGGVVTWTPTWE